MDTVTILNMCCPRSYFSIYLVYCPLGLAGVSSTEPWGFLSHSNIYRPSVSLRHKPNNEDRLCKTTRNSAAPRVSQPSIGLKTSRGSTLHKKENICKPCPWPVDNHWMCTPRAINKRLLLPSVRRAATWSLPIPTWSLLCFVGFFVVLEIKPRSPQMLV